MSTPLEVRLKQRAVTEFLVAEGESTVNIHKRLQTVYKNKTLRLLQCEEMDPTSDDKFRKLFSKNWEMQAYGLSTSIALWQFSVSLRPLVQTLGSWLASGASWSSAINPSLGRGR